MKRSILAASAAIAVLGLVAGCTSDPLAEDYANGTQQNYVSGDGSITELPPAERGDPVEFEGQDADGTTISSADFAEQPFVVNFWFASCAPCLVEAPDLADLSTEYAELGVRFLGVNTYDGAFTAQAFEERFGIEYPSVLDAQNATVQVAFSGVVSANAVPTTLVVDRDGRVAARISGVISDPKILSDMIDKVLAEAD